MRRGHNVATCQYCSRDYMCGDCITSNCELGRNRKQCEHYQAHIAKEKAAASQLMKLFNDPSKTKSAAARLLAGNAWDTVAESLTNAELAEEIKINVWAIQKLGTWEIALLEQVIERLAKTQI